MDYVRLAPATRHPQLERITVHFRQDFRLNAGLQMQIVHVLGNQVSWFVRFLKFHQSVMAPAGFHPAQGLFHLLWRQSLFLPRPDLRPGRGSRTFRIRYLSGAGKKNRMPGFKYPFCQFPDSCLKVFGHIKSPPRTYTAGGPSWQG